MKYVADKMPLRAQINPLRALTMPRIVSLIEQGAYGYFADLMWLYAWVERREPVLRALVERRVAAIKRCEWSVKIEAEVEDSDNAALRAEADRQREELENLLSGIENLREATGWLAMATFRGFAHLEKSFSDGKLTRLVPVPQWYWAKRYPETAWLFNKDALNVNAGEPIIPERFVIREVESPVDEVAAIEFMRKNLNQKDWDGFNETFGIPNVFAETPENTSQAEIEQYQYTLERMLTNGRGVLPPGVEVKLSEPGNLTGAQFEARLRYIDQMLVIAGTGGKLTMLSEATGIGSGASEAHRDVFDDIAAAEADDIAELLFESIGKVRLNAVFPGRDHLAYFELANDSTEVTKEGADAVRTLRQTGYEVTPEVAAAVSGVPIEGLVSQDPAVAPPSPPGGNPEAGPGRSNDGSDDEGATEDEQERERRMAAANNRNGNGPLFNTGPRGTGETAFAFNPELAQVIREMGEVAKLEEGELRNSRLVLLQDKLLDVLDSLNRNPAHVAELETSMLEGLAEGFGSLPTIRP